MRRKNADAQATFEWSEPQPEPAPQPPPVATESPPERTERKLDAEGHRWLAELARDAQAHSIGLAAQQTEPANMGELAKVAKQWKVFAAMHEAMGREEEVRG